MEYSKVASYAAALLVVVYLAHTAQVFYQLFTPTECIPDTNSNQIRCLTPYLKRNPVLKLCIYVSTAKTLKYAPSGKVKFIWKLQPFDVNNISETALNITLPPSVVRNGSYYLHSVLLPVKADDLVRITESAVSISSTSLTTYRVKKADEYHLIHGKQENTSSTISEQKVKSKMNEDLRPISHWHPHITVCVMADNVSIPTTAIPMDLYPFISVRQQATTRSNDYNPILYIDAFSSRSVDAIPIPSNATQLSLNLNYKPISYGKLRLRLHIQMAIGNMHSLGFTDKDTDEIKGLLADTNLYLLLLTFTVSVFHLIFDFLAFKNDISFWRSRKTMVGISSRTVIWRCVSQLIIFLYLMDQEQVSLLVLIPQGIGTLIEIWKVARALKVELDWSVRMLFLFPSVKFGDKSKQEGETEEFDSQAMTYLSYILYPLCTGGAIYSLLYIPHKSWYSWCVSCLVNGVYVFGFLFMLPQLFLNYKLKSVAHLPWRAFMYKAFNTFIDDLFAFIITMPMAHRLACFRDDIIFLLYLYQRWLYPVDKSRPNEFGQVFEDKSDEKEKAD